MNASIILRSLRHLLPGLVLFVSLLPLRADVSSGLVGYWPFEEAAGTVAFDRSGTNNHGTLTGALIWTNGVVGSNAIHFPASTAARVGLPDATSLQITGALSLVAWVRPGVAGQSSHIIGRAGSTSQRGYQLFCENSGPSFAAYGLRLSSNGSPTVAVSLFTPDNAIVASVWTHVVGVFDPSLGSSQMKIYTNGVLCAQRDTPLTYLNVTAGVQPRIGVRGDTSSAFNGRIDEPRIYNRALSAADVMDLYLNKPPGNEHYQTSVETAADGGGMVVAAQSIDVGTPLVVYAIARDKDGNFIGNIPAYWSLTNVTGGLVYTNLLVGPGMKSATFIGRALGSAKILATANATNGLVSSGVITVQAQATPAGLAVAMTNVTATVTWTAAPGATNYVLSRSTVSGGPYTAISTNSAVTYTDAGLAVATTYYYVVRAQGPLGESPDTAQVSGTTAPVAATGVAATPYNGQVNLTWVGSAVATNYLVERSDGGPYALVGQTALKHYVDASVVNGTAYDYRVLAANGAGAGAPSSVVSAAPSASEPLVLAYYSFGGPEAAGGTPAAEIQAPNVSATPLATNESSRITLSAFIAGGTYPASYPDPVAIQVGVPTGANVTSAATALASNSYYSFTLSADAGSIFTATNLSFLAARGGASEPRGFVLRSSADNFAANLLSTNIPTVRSNWTTFTVPLAGPGFVNRTSVTFRVFPYAPNGTSMEFDDVRLLGVVQANISPVAKAFTMGVAQGDSATVAILGGKYAPTDADGHVMLVSDVSLDTPANGGAVAVTGSGSNVTYTASNAWSGTDTFTYTVTDEAGGTDTKTVTVIVQPAGSGANIVAGSFSVSGTTVSLQAFGIPGATYRLQYTDSLNPVAWTNVTGSEVVAGSNGVMSFSHADTGAIPPARYYRTQYVSGPP